MKRNLDILVISDLHLGTYGSEADEFLAYLDSINADKIVINGDFVDIMLFNKNFWPSSHMKVIKYFLELISQGKEIYYVTGNHDELMRKFLNFKIQKFKIVNQIILDTAEGKVWIFHGDVFDFSLFFKVFQAQILRKYPRRSCGSFWSGLELCIRPISS